MELPNDYICEGQLSIWDCMMGATPFKFDPHKVLRVIELFAGYGSQSMALKRLGIPFEHHKVVEFDKYAIRSFNAVHGTDFPVIDIRDVKGKDLEIVDKDKYQYLMTYSFPCTDLSVAGAMKGMEEGSGTRSSLLWEVKRLLEESEELPDVLMMENVPQVHGENNIKAFDRWLLFLERKGYRTIYKDMNAKHYGVAQSRSRCFAISILGNHTYKFPNPFPLKKTMRDYLEDDVDERYYLTNEKAKNLIDKLVADGKIPTEQNRTEQNRTEQQLTSALRNQEPSTAQTVSKQDTMLESVTNKQMVPVLLSGQASVFDKFTNEATCLMSRDYKGMGNQSSNGVIEVNEWKMK